MDRSKDSDPYVAFNANAHKNADIIVAMVFKSAQQTKSYWQKWPHWNAPKGMALPKGHALEGFHVVPPEKLGCIRQGDLTGTMPHQGELEWLMDVVWDIKHHDDSRPVPLPVELADPYWAKGNGKGSTQALICGMWIGKEVMEKTTDEKPRLQPKFHPLPDFDILKQNQWLFQEIDGLLSVEIIVVTGGTSKFNPNIRQSGRQRILKSFKWER